MSSPFFESSKRIANDFLQTIVFIDDRAFVQEGADHHEFDAKQITRAFADSQKVCAVYKPETIDDINNLALLAKKSDVTVLDWQINIEEEQEGDGEEDVDEDDPRGPHTKKIIREILSDPLTGKGSLKLILIYTGETNLPDIADAVFEDLQPLSLEGLKRDDCSVFTENIRILVVAKPASDEAAGDPKFKYSPGLNDKVIPYSELPDFILTKFTEMTAGLLTNFVLQSLTVIRNNTFRLIKLYKKELDPSFLSHRLLLPNGDDSKEHLIEILSNSIQAMLNYNETGEVVSIEQIFDWLDYIDLNQTISIKEGKEIEINADFIKEWATADFITACKKQWVAKGYSNESNTPDKTFRTKEKEFQKIASEYFIGTEATKIDSEFSILSHHKSNLKQPSSSPRLTLGTLVRQIPEEKEASGDKESEQPNERYYLCIQARCDSVRIERLRKFLFLPLQKIVGNNNFHFVAEDEGEFVRLSIVKDAFELRTIKFEPNSKNQIVEAEVVEAEEKEKKYFFHSNHGERFMWLADLKDAHAQREANNFAAKISRVGLDEYEWLRRWGTN